MLGLTEESRLCARQHKGEPSGQLGAGRTNLRLDEVGQGRIAVIEEGLRPELDLP